MTSTDSILEVEKVDQVYRTGFWLKPAPVLHGVSLRVPRKSIFGFLGANGAGKTTLIQLIVGLRKPTAGSVRVGGDEAWTAQARSRIGFLPERPYFYEHLTGEQLLRYLGTLAGMSRAQIEARIAPVLETVGMTHARKRELRKYSKGMLQRIGLAQAILHDPEFLVLDEPMSGLDPLGRKEIRELILALAREGKTIFFSSHVIPDVEAICDQVALIERGRILGCGPVDALLPAAQLGVEVRFSGLRGEQARRIEGLALERETPEGWTARVENQAAVTPVLNALLAQRAEIQAVIPIRPSLEKFFQGARE